MKIGIYSITYRGVWYKGEALDVFQLARLAKSQGWEGLELDAERPHAAPMDLRADDRQRLRDLAGELGLPLSAVVGDRKYFDALPKSSIGSTFAKIPCNDLICYYPATYLA